MAGTEGIEEGWGAPAPNWGDDDRGGHPHLGRSLSCVASHGFQKGTEHGMAGLVASGF